MEPITMTKNAATESKTSTQTAASKIETCEDFQIHLINLILEKKYEEVAQLFTGEEREKYFSYIKESGSDIYRDVCLPQLNKSSFDMSFPLYSCMEELLKVIAEHGSRELILMELLELVEECDSEHVFSSALHALQIVLLRLADTKPMALQWALNSVHNRLAKIELPESLTNGEYDEQKMTLLEQEATIQTLLTHYVTVGLFYTPLLEACLNSAADVPRAIFRDNNLTRRNILCCFFIQLLSKPIALLELSTDTKKPGSNAYTRQVTRQLVLSAVQCLKGDPLYLLQFVEERLRYKRRLDSSKGVYELSSHNIFTAEEHMPILGIAVFYYLIFLEFKDSEQLNLPRIYAPLFLYQSLLYLATVFLQRTESQLQLRGLLLAKYMLNMLRNSQMRVPANYLEIPVQREFCEYLTTIIGYTEAIAVRRLGVEVLDAYIKQFDDEGIFIVLKGLMTTVTHNSLLGHLATLYKNMVSELLKNEILPASFNLNDFRNVLLNNICHLPRNAETDLIENSNQIIAALNTLIYFGLSDKKNLTGLRNFSHEIENQYLVPLRTALDFSISHYQQEIKQIKEGDIEKIKEEERRQLELLDVTFENGKKSTTQNNLELDSERKIIILKQHLTTFDLISHLLAYVTTLFSSKALKKRTSLKF